MVPTVKFPVGLGRERIGKKAVKINDKIDSVNVALHSSLRISEEVFWVFILRLGNPSKTIKPKAINSGYIIHTQARSAK
jgi:hypothetical protein